MNKLEAILSLLFARDYVVVTQRTEREETKYFMGNDILHWYRTKEITPDMREVIMKISETLTIDEDD